MVLISAYNHVNSSGEKLSKFFTAITYLCQKEYYKQIFKSYLKYYVYSVHALITKLMSLLTSTCKKIFLVWINLMSVV